MLFQEETLSLIFQAKFQVMKLNNIPWGLKKYILTTLKHENIMTDPYEQCFGIHALIHTVFKQYMLLYC